MKSLPILALLLLLVGGGGYFLFSGQGNETDISGPGLEDDTSKDDDETEDSGQGGTIEIDNGKSDKSDGDEGDGARRSVSEISESLEQGVEGLLISDAGGAVKNAQIHIVEGISTSNMFAVLARLAGSGGRAPAKVVRSGKSDNRGFFKIDCPPNPSDAPFDLRIVADGHQLHSQPLRVAEKQWMKLGTLTLKKGTVLAGTVRDKETRQVVAGAIVRLMPSSLNALSPTPGLEDGYEVTTDKNGRYEFSGLPADPMQLSAFAKGYGSFIKGDVTVTKQSPPQREDIELPKGCEITGYVVDAEGTGIPRARVEATPLTSQSPSPGSTFTNEDGAFTILGLTEGQFIVSAQANGFSKNEKKPVAAGSKDVAIALEQQSSILAVVKNRRGRPVQSYTATILRFFPENPEHYGKTDITPVRARSKLGEAELSGVDAGHYIVQVDASGYAKTFSKHVEVREGQRQKVRVNITLLEGGTLFGVVVDSQGKPVPNAAVQSLSVDYQDNPLWESLRGLQPQRITAANATTDRQGRFRLEKLTPSPYQLRVVHASFARGYFKQYDVAEGEQKDVGRLQLKAGVRVRGQVRIAGRPGAGVEITLTRTKELDGTPSKTQVFERVFANEKGEWQVGRILSEGVYDVQGARMDHANQLMKIVDIQHSKREIRVVRGMPIVMVSMPDSK